MPLDPLIALANHPVSTNMPDPLAVQQQRNQLQLQQQALQTGQLQQIGLGQENQMRGRAIDAQNQLNQALQNNTTKDPVTGAPIVNYDGVADSMTKAGYGREALQFRQSIDALKTSDANLSELQQRIQFEQGQHVGAMAGAILDAPPEARGIIYSRVTQLAQQAGYLKPGQLPAQYSPDLDGTLSALREGSLSAEQQYGAKFNEAKNEAYRLRAEAAEQRANEAYQRARNAEANRRYVDTGRVDPQGHPISLDQHTGQFIVSGVTGSKPADTERVQHDRAMEGIAQQNADTRAANAGGQGGLTPNAQGVQNRFNQKEQDAGRKQLDSLNTLRTAYGQALTTANDDQYVDPQTKKIATMNDDSRSALQQQLKNVTNQGVRIMRRFGWPNEFNDPDGQKAYDAVAPSPQTAAPGQPQQQPAPQQKPQAGPKPGATDPKQQIKVKLPNGQWLSGPRANVDAYLKRKGFSLQQ